MDVIISIQSVSKIKKTFKNYIKFMGGNYINPICF